MAQPDMLPTYIKLIVGVVCFILAIGGGIYTAWNLKKKHKMKKKYESDDARELFNLNVRKAYDQITNDATNQILYAQNPEIDYPRAQGAVLKKVIKDLEATVNYSHKSIDANIKDALNQILDRMAKFQQNLCRVNVLICQSKNVRLNPDLHYRYSIEIQAKVNECSNLVTEWTQIYGGIASKLI